MLEAQHLMAIFHLNCILISKRMSLKTRFCTDFQKKCVLSRILIKEYLKKGFLRTTENPIHVFFYQYLSPNTFFFFGGGGGGESLQKCVL